MNNENMRGTKMDPWGPQNIVLLYLTCDLLHSHTKFRYDLKARLQNAVVSRWQPLLHIGELLPNIDFTGWPYPYYKPPYQIWMKSDQWLKRQCVATTWPIKKESWCNFQPKVGQVWPYANQVWRPLVQTSIPNLNEIWPMVQEIMCRNHLTHLKRIMAQFSEKSRSSVTIF